MRGLKTGVPCLDLPKKPPKALTLTLQAWREQDRNPKSVRLKGKAKQLEIKWSQGDYVLAVNSVAQKLEFKFLGPFEIQVAQKTIPTPFKTTKEHQTPVSKLPPTLPICDCLRQGLPPPYQLTQING